ncbi:hypothetical protein Tco_1280965 [Tanacetum coccineum]
MIVAFTDHEDIADLQGCANLVDPWLPCVKVSILSRFIINAEKSRGVSISSSNDSRGPSSRAKFLNQG